MPSALQRWLEPPPMDSEDDDARARLFYRMAVVLLGAVCVLVPVHLAVDRGRLESILGTYGVVALFHVVVIGLLRARKLRPAGILYIGAYFASMTSTIWQYGGIGSPFPATYITISLLAGLVLGSRPGIFVGALSLVSLSVMGLAEGAGLRPDPPIELGLSDMWISWSINLVFAAFFVHSAIGNLTKTLARVRTNEEALERRATHATDLARLAQQAVDATSTDVFLEHALPSARETLHVEVAAVYELMGNALVRIRCEGEPETPRRLPVAGWSEILEAPHATFRDEDETPSGLEGALPYVLCTPLPGRHRAAGVMVFGSRKPWLPEDDELRYAQMLAATVGTVVERASIEQSLRQAQKMEAVGRLAGGVAHDFNNLLTSIVGCAEALGEELPPGVDPELVADILAASERGARLTQQLLTFSRRKILQPEVLSIDVVLGELDRVISRLLGEDVHVTIDLGDGEARVRMDRSSLEQVLLNLAVNAREAMPNGGELQIAVRRISLDALPEQAEAFSRAGPGKYSVMVVRDAGVGMDDDTKQRIFEPFFTTKEDGSGIGLATVFGAVQQAGGFVTVESTPEVGTTFSVYLPEAPGDEAARASVPPAMERLGGDETILLVEDSDDVRRTARRILERAGYAVLAVDDGAEALRLLEARDDIDLVLSDVVMKHVHGPELARSIPADGPPIVFMSGYAAELGQRSSTRDVGPFLAKPFTARELLAQVRAVLDESKRA